MAKVVHAVSIALDLDEETVIKSAGLSVLSADSVKAALDIDWDDEAAQTAALDKLMCQVDALETWVAKRASKQREVPPLKEPLAMLRKLVAQDIEPDPTSGGRRIKQEVARETASSPYRIRKCDMAGRARPSSSTATSGTSRSPTT
jgi:hypothetical protein